MYNIFLYHILMYILCLSEIFESITPYYLPHINSLLSPVRASLAFRTCNFYIS